MNGHDFPPVKVIRRDAVVNEAALDFNTVPEKVAGQIAAHREGARCQVLEFLWL
jgi:hypothetical protein